MLKKTASAMVALAALLASAAPGKSDGFSQSTYISKGGWKWGGVYGRPTGAKKNPCTVDREKCIVSFKSLCGRYSFSIDCSQTPDLLEWAEKKLKPVVEEWYARMADELGSPNYRPYAHISYRIAQKQKVPGFCTGRRISLNAGWIRKRLDNVSLGMVIHETWHSLQGYRAKKLGWIKEALADWVRYYYYQGFTYEQGLKSLRVNPRKAKAASKYGTGATFLEWCRRTYGTRFVHDLIDALRSGEFNGDWWKRRTGKTFGELEAEWRASAPEAPPPKPKKKVIKVRKAR